MYTPMDVTLQVLCKYSVFWTNDDNNLSFYAGSNEPRMALWQRLAHGIFYVALNILCCIERAQGRWSAFSSLSIPLWMRSVEIVLWSCAAKRWASEVDMTILPPRGVGRNEAGAQDGRIIQSCYSWWQRPVFSYVHVQLSFHSIYTMSLA